MTRKEALAELIAKVEAGDDKGFRAANRAVFSTPCQDVNLQLREENCRHAYKGSLDAALALHQAALPPNSTWQYYSGDGHCIVGFGPGPTDYDEAHHETPARAWLLAILKALHEMEENK